MPDQGHDTSLTIDGRTVELTRPGKVLFPADEITKADVVDYYRRVADVMVPHLRDRPLMLQRFPDGIDGDAIVQKQASEHFPAWIRRAEMAKQAGSVEHVVCDDAATLAYLAGQACITPHRWLTRVDRPDRPDMVVFDLDPSGSDPEASFGTVRAAARSIGDVLRSTGLVPFVQTAGSLRARPGAPVATPLEWRELSGRRMGPQRFTMSSVLRRLARRNDPWADLDGQAASLDEARHRLAGAQGGREARAG
jgi:bifunctional non-homologous end joining protein LigD